MNRPGSMLPPLPSRALPQLEWDDENQFEQTQPSPRDHEKLGTPLEELPQSAFVT